MKNFKQINLDSLVSRQPNLGSGEPEASGDVFVTGWGKVYIPGPWNEECLHDLESVCSASHPSEPPCLGVTKATLAGTAEWPLVDTSGSMVFFL